MYVILNENRRKTLRDSDSMCYANSNISTTSSQCFQRDSKEASCSEEPYDSSVRTQDELLCSYHRNHHKVLLSFNCY